LFFKHYSFRRSAAQHTAVPRIIVIRYFSGGRHSAQTHPFLPQPFTALVLYASSSVAVRRRERTCARETTVAAFERYPIVSQTITISYD
jgi:hypothetical protein